MSTEEETEIEVVVERPKRFHIIDEFLLLNAINKKNAIKLEDLTLDLEIYEEKILELIDLELLIPATKTKYYLDKEAYEVYKEKENKKFFLTLISIIIPGILFVLLGIAWLILAL